MEDKDPNPVGGRYLLLCHCIETRSRASQPSI